MLPIYASGSFGNDRQHASGAGERLARHLAGYRRVRQARVFQPRGSLKDRPVRQILLDALTNGALSPGKTILDSSSGNAGIAYAMLGAALGYPVALVVPENASLERRKRIVAHGANLTPPTR